MRAPIDTVPALIVPGPARSNRAAAHAVRKAFNGHHNLITPDVHGFALIGSRWAVELSSGEGFRDRRTGECPTIWAVTVVCFIHMHAEHRLCSVHTTRDSACRYLGKLAQLDAYRSIRAVIVASCKADRAHYMRHLGLDGDEARAQRVNACERLTAKAFQLAALRRAYAATLDRFGAEPLALASADTASTIGERHAAARQPVARLPMVAQPVQQAQARHRGPARRGMARSEGDGTWQVGIYCLARNDAGAWAVAATGPGTIGDGYVGTFATWAAAYEAVTGEPVAASARAAG